MILCSWGNHDLMQHKINLKGEKSKEKTRIQLVFCFFFFLLGSQPSACDCLSTYGCTQLLPAMASADTWTARPGFSPQLALTERIPYLLGFLYTQNSTKRSIKERLMKLLPCSAAKTSSPAVQSKFVCLFVFLPQTLCFVCLGLNALQFSASKENQSIYYIPQNQLY